MLAAKAANDMLKPEDRDPALVGALIGRRQLVKLGLYGVALRAFNLKAKAFLDQDLAAQKAALDNLPACAAPNEASAACKDAKYDAIKKALMSAGVADEIVKAAVIIELAKIRGAFVWKYLSLAGERVKQLWWGTIKCAVFFKKNAVSLFSSFYLRRACARRLSGAVSSSGRVGQDSRRRWLANG